MPLVFDERIGEYVEIEEHVKPALSKLTQKPVSIKSSPPLSIHSKHRNDSTWPSKEARRQASIGGKRRLVTMLDHQRSAVARKAANTRWAKKRLAKYGVSTNEAD